MQRAFGLVSLLLVAGASVLVSLAVGSVPISVEDTFAALSGSLSGPTADIVWKLRLPRIVAGVLLCGLLRWRACCCRYCCAILSPIPYILACRRRALGVLLAMLLGTEPWFQTGSGWRRDRRVGPGIRFEFPYRKKESLSSAADRSGGGAGLNAALSLILVLAPQTAVKGMLFWLMGDLGYAEFPLPALLALVTLLFVVMPLAQSMNVLELGRIKAQSLGVAVTGTEILLYGLAAVATVTAVLFGGTIGFVGLIVPHLMRMLGMADHRWLLPSAVLAGGSFLAIADTIARSAWAPLQFPVGVLTALLGVPVLLLLLAGRGNAAR